MLNPNSSVSIGSGRSQSPLCHLTMLGMFLLAYSSVLAQPALVASNECAVLICGHRTKIAGELYHPAKGRIKGSPLLNTEWMPGMVYFSNGDSLVLSSMNYDAYLGELIYMNQVLNRQVMIDRQSLKGFDLRPSKGRSDRRFRRLGSANEFHSNYVEVLLTGTISLLVVRKTDLIIDEGTPPALHPDYFLSNHKYHMLLQDSTTRKLKPSFTQLYRYFPENKKEIKQYIKSQHLKVSVEADLIQVFRYINEIETR